MIMKIRLLLGFSLAFILGAFFVNGCKTTVSDPVYVATAEIRFADYHQQTPLKIYMYPPNPTHEDSISASKTPTPMTYGIVTPYLTSLSTNRQAGEKYHLVAFDPTTNATAAFTDVILKPGDRLTWLISGPGGVYDTTLINDNHPNNQNV